MQTVDQTFIDASKANIRLISWRARAAFSKSFDGTTSFFILDTSTLNSGDVLAPTDNNIAQEWDKYTYTEYTNRVISIEITSEEADPFSITQSYADITFNNYDDFFTPNSGSPIDQYILPRRPFRLYAGFQGESIPQFVGLSDGMPEINKNNRTARFHLIDFMTFLFDKEISETIMKVNISTGEAIDYLFQLVGLTSGQYNIDQTSFNRIPFFFVEKGEKLGKVIKDLMEAEQGRLYMDEYGVINFLNRQNYSTTPVFFFDKSNTIDYKVSREDDIINSVRIECEILQEFSDVSLWQLAQPVYVPIGTSVDVWIELLDPATVIDTPAYSATQIESSYFSTHRNNDGTEDYTDINISAISKFAKAAKITFENVGLYNAYVTAIDLWGTSVRVEDEIIVEDQDATSVTSFEEQRYEFTTRYIQDPDSAESKAAIMIDDYKDYGSMLEIDVKGNLALQIGDTVTVSLDGYSGNYVIKKIINILSDDRYIQRLTVKVRNPRKYFILNISQLDNTDALAP